MVRVDAAHAAEPVFGDPGVPLVEAQLVLAAGDAQAVEGDAGHDRATAAAHGAVAATDVLVAVDELDFEFDGLAVAGAGDGDGDGGHAMRLAVAWCRHDGSS